jgi:hypothetical protein
VAIVPDIAALDPELEALPEPRRPWRRLTLAVMLVTTCCSAWLAWRLAGAAAYATTSRPPLDLGSLTGVQLDSAVANRWARATGKMGAGAVQFRRPLDADRYRVAPIDGAENVWVQVRVPAGLEASHYVPPNSFVGRLVPFRELGLRHDGVREAVQEATGEPLPAEAWLLMDGEAPQTSRWVLGVVALLLVFAVLNVVGIAHLLRPVQDG